MPKVDSGGTFPEGDAAGVGRSGPSLQRRVRGDLLQKDFESQDLLPKVGEALTSKCAVQAFSTSFSTEERKAEIRPSASAAWSSS